MTVAFAESVVLEGLILWGLWLLWHNVIEKDRPR
jgi:hypothetical protein